MARHYGDVSRARLPADLVRKHLGRIRDSIERQDLSPNILMCTAVVFTALIGLLALSFDKG